MVEEELFTAPKSRTWAATIGALLAAILITAAMPVWLPLSDANRIVLPIVFFPLTWLAVFFWVVFAKSMLRTWAIIITLIVGNAVLVATSVGAL